MSGFIDLQINGFGGVDFNELELSAEALHLACEKIQADGVDGFLATVITDHLDKMESKLARLVALREQDPLAKKMILGFHIEGPYISPVTGYVGAHPKDAVSPASVDGVKRLLDAAGGLTKIFTLAPECDSDNRTTKYCTDNGVIVSAGHTDATLDELKAAIDSGLSMMTHLGNGCPMEMHRHDNIIQRVLHFSEHLNVGLIADGAHIPFFALKNYIDFIGMERCFVVTDAISAAGMGTGTFTLGDQEVVIDNDLVPRAPDRSHFVGSAAPSSRMAQNLKEHLGFSEDQIRQLWVTNPGKILGLDS